MFAIHVIAIGALGQGLSGGDRIFIELSRRWSKKAPVHIYVWEEGMDMIKREKLTGKGINVHLVKVGKLSKIGFIFTYIYRILLGVKLGFTLKLDNKEPQIVYSASEFWMDSIPALLISKRHKNAKWVAAWYQTAPNPLRGFSEVGQSGRYRFSAFLYWLVQLPIKPLVSNFSDLVLVNNVSEKDQFPRLKKEGKTSIVFGAVDLDRIAKYIKNNKKLGKKKYLGVFQGRFHPQKGVVELIDIWKRVVVKIPGAKLAMIGDGPLMHEVKKRIESYGLSKNIHLFGYVSDGPQKYRIFSDAKIVMHPALYDSGGMASAEAMAFGIPCIGFDLISYKSYYPKGMYKVKEGSIEKFAGAVFELAKNNKVYKKYSHESKELIQESWSWDTRANELFSRFEKLIK